MDPYLLERLAAECARNGDTEGMQNAYLVAADIYESQGRRETSDLLRAMAGDEEAAKRVR